MLWRVEWGRWGGCDRGSVLEKEMVVRFGEVRRVLGSGDIDIDGDGDGDGSLGCEGHGRFDIGHIVIG